MNKKLKATVFRFTNTAILGLVIILVLSGVYSFIWISGGWAVDIHRIAAWGLLALVPWKIGITWRSLKRGLGRRIDRNVVLGVSLSLALLVVLTIVSAVLWTWQIGSQRAFGQFLLWWHWILAFVLLVPLTIHVWRRWPKPKQVDFTSRRAALRLIGLGAVGLIGWQLAEALAEFRATAETARLITGSRLSGAFTGNDFPITSERSPTIDLAAWRLHIGGAVNNAFVLSAADLAAYPHSQIEATLDCTNGWWTIQNWGGVPLDTLLEQAEVQSKAIAVRMTSLTGYSQVFTLEEAHQIMVGTQVGGEGLSHLHGAPARAIVPQRRGWFWVKWLSEIELLDSIDDVLKHPFTIR